MNKDIAYCSNCDKMFKFKNCQNIYRCGDTYVCSYICSKARYRELKNIDPGFSYPHTWTLDKSSSTNSLCNLDLPSKDEKDSQKNVNKNIIKNETKDYNIIYEPEESTPLIVKNVKTADTIPKVIVYNEVMTSRFRILCARYFMVGVSSLCAIRIMIAITV